MAFARCFIGQPALLAVWGIKVYCRHDQGAAKQARVVERTVREGVRVVCQGVGFRSGPMTEGELGKVTRMGREGDGNGEGKVISERGIE